MTNLLVGTTLVCVRYGVVRGGVVLDFGLRGVEVVIVRVEWSPLVEERESDILEEQRGKNASLLELFAKPDHLWLELSLRRYRFRSRSCPGTAED